ncbi:unnamed protein product [Staurois parvus]|uniref:Gamma-secretase subunit APH-1 n=1 Tax=Staurois parvus TaxID=386267 RepID=A0ABN9B7C8_9NEOB|nr:unnamed protein product [Staurois parvus]
MGAAVFFGCTFVAFGPALSLFILTIARDPLRVIILVAGSFFWLVSVLLSSLIWFISVQVSNKNDSSLQYGLLIFGAAISVLLQEVFRYAYYRLLKLPTPVPSLKQNISTDNNGTFLFSPTVSGFSFGIISGVFSVINILADAVGPGIVGVHGDSQYYFLTSAFLTMAIVFPAHLLGHHILCRL